MLQNLIDKINSAELFEEPFAHINFKGFFEQDYYEQMLDNFPSLNNPHMKNFSKIYVDRFVIDLDDKSGNPISKLPNNIKKEMAFWFDFKKLLLHNDLMECLLEKYRDYVPFKYWNDVYPTARLSIDKKPYSIGAHVDKSSKLVSAMFYLPSKDLPEEVSINYGTALLVPKNEEHKFLEDHQDLDDFDCVKVARYEQNGFFSWGVTNKSYHGVYPLEYDYLRPTIGYFIWNRENTKDRLK